jgi:hypothetical protein
MKHDSNRSPHQSEKWSLTELSDLRKNRWVEEVYLPPAWPHPDSSEWATKSGNSDIKIGDNER